MSFIRLKFQKIFWNDKDSVEFGRAMLSDFDSLEMLKHLYLNWQSPSYYLQVP